MGRFDPVGWCSGQFGESYTADVRAMMESVRDHEVTLAISANATGKTHAAARVAVWFYKTHPGAQVYTAAAPPLDNLSRLLWGEIGSLVTKHREAFGADAVKGLHIERNPQQFITGVTIPASGTSKEREAKFSGKHAPHLLFVLDEADAIPEEVYAGIESCMSGGHARLLMMFNPRQATGTPYRMQRDGQAHVVHLSAFRHPNVVTGTETIPGAVNRQKTGRRINEWCRPLAPGEKPDSECFEMPGFLVGFQAVSAAKQPYPPIKAGWWRVVNPAFAYMVLGQYPAAGSNQLISREWVARARARHDAYVSVSGDVPPLGADGIQGVDVGEFGDDPTVSVIRWGGFVRFQESWGKVDPVESGDRAAAIYHDHGVSRACVDATGVGSGTAPQMRRRGCTSFAVKVSERPTKSTELGEFKLLRDQLWWECREWLRADPGAMLPPDEELIEELATPTYEIKKGKVVVMDKDTMRDLLKRSPNKADALCMTFAPVDESFPEFSEDLHTHTPPRLSIGGELQCH